MAKCQNVSNLSRGEYTVNKKINDKGISELKPYKVDNAIILAAGKASRCMPLSKYLPKGLFCIKGEILIERQITQLLSAGIEEIIVVVGYQKEKFEYLRNKYGVIIIENPEFNKKNNISSLFYAREHMRNTYICCADNYFKENVFSKKVEYPYYSCKYSEHSLNEYFVETNEQDIIIRVNNGGEHGWYTMGEAFFNEESSQFFINQLVKEYDAPKTGLMTWDDFHAKYVSQIPLHIMKRSSDEVLEFDTIGDILEFDIEFQTYYNKIIEFKESWIIDKK